MKKLLLFVLLLPGLIAGAALKEIVVVGNFDHGDNPEFFGETLPVPFEFRLQFDTNAVDEDPLSTHGKYETEGVPVSLSFGSYFYETLDTEVQVWSGDLGFWGFTFGNEHAFESTQNGRFLSIGDYELYGSFITPFAQSQQQAPTDELRWISENGFYPEATGLNYLYIIGTTSSGERIRLQETAIGGGIGAGGFTVQDVVPEPSAAVLLLAGTGLILARRRSRS